MSNINNSHIDFNLLPKNIPSLCIPRVFPNISEARIRKTFEDIFIGRIEKIDIIKGDKFNRVFVHLIWNNTSDALYVRNQVMTGKDVKVVYDKQWYWMISASRNQSPPQPQPQPQQLSHKTDEFGRELRTQEEPLIKPILQRHHACFQPPPPPTPPPMPLPMPILQRQHACFQPPLPPTPPPNYHHYQQPQQRQQAQQPMQRQRQPPPQQQQRISKQPIKRYNHQEQKQELTDEFGRDIRRPQPPPSSHRPCPVSEKQKQKSWSSYDDDNEDDEEELNNPVFIPQSPTSTPPSLRRKQIQVQEEVHIIEQEVHVIEEEEDVVPSLTRSTDVDHPRQADMVQVKYDEVLPLKKIRTNNKKSKK
jgi:hypothetical protein